MACLGAIPGHKRGSDSNRFRGEQRHSPSLHWIRNRHEILLPSSLFRDSLRRSFAYFELFFDSNSPLSWKQVGVSTLKFSPIILKFIRRFRILFAFICLGFIFFLHLSKHFEHLFVLVSLLNYGKISNFYLYI